jgi:protein-glutamine gamma-glutamyltransferase
VLAFLMVLSAALLTVDSIFLLGFSLFLLSAVAAFILLEMKHTSSKAAFHIHKNGNDATHQRMALSLMRTAPAIVVLVLLGTAAIFFALPRVSGGYLSAYAPSGGFSTGFSDHVELGAIGQIQQSSAVVMHIAIDGDQNGEHNLKWRGVTLSRFEGTSWTNPFRARALLPLDPGQFDLRPPSWQGRPLAPASVHYRVLMEPIGSEVFFLAARPETLEGNYRLVGKDYGEAIFNWDGARSVGVYEASSDTAQPSAAELRATRGSYPAGFDAYLQLPPLDLRIPELAAQITASASNNYDKAAALETYLSTQFGYTLQLPSTPPHDPLANFLFERKRGHCEYFASAMAVMLRTLKIPSRVVNGFRTGEFNDVTSQYVVRASDAHSWVEAYFPGYGWISFDPTPPSGTIAGDGWGRLGLYMDAMASFWREWVVNYDAAHQSVVGQEAAVLGRLRLAEVSGWAQRHYAQMLGVTRRLGNRMAGSPRRWSTRAVLLVALFVLALNAGRIGRKLHDLRLAAKPERSPRQAATLWYERMVRKVGRKGWSKSPVQTPQEFAGSIEDGPLRASVAEFTRHYEGARFGGSIEDAQRLPELYEAVSSGDRR